MTLSDEAVLQLVALCCKPERKAGGSCQYNGGMEKNITIACLLFALCGSWTGAVAADAQSGDRTQASAAAKELQDQTASGSPAVRAKNKSRKFHSVSAATRKVKRKTKKADQK